MHKPKQNLFTSRARSLPAEKELVYPENEQFKLLNAKMSGFLYQLVKNDDEMKLDKQSYVVSGHELINNPEAEQRIALNLENTQLQKIYNNDLNMHGFKLMLEVDHKNHNTTFYTHSIEERDRWINCLKQSVILLDFHNDFEVWQRESFPLAYLGRRREKVDGRKYALKRFRKTAGTNEYTDAMKSEIAIMRAMNHPSIIQMVEIYDDQAKFVYMVLPFLEGKDLNERIEKNGPLSDCEAALVMFSFFEALGHLIKKGIVHGDLKPQNLTLQSKFNDYKFVITDFSMANFVGKQNTQNTQSKNASLGFVAPEILAHKTCHTFESDMFSAGLIMHVLLTGTQVFTGTDDEILKKNMNCEFDFSASWKNISDEALDLISKILISDPKNRIKPKDALLHPWFNKYLVESKEIQIDLAKFQLEMKELPKSVHEKINSGRVSSSEAFLPQLVSIKSQDLKDKPESEKVVAQVEEPKEINIESKKESIEKYVKDFVKKKKESNIGLTQQEDDEEFEVEKVEMLPLLGFGLAIDYKVKFSRSLNRQIDRKIGLDKPVQKKIDRKLNIHELEFGKQKKWGFFSTH